MRSGSVAQLDHQRFDVGLGDRLDFPLSVALDHRLQRCGIGGAGGGLDPLPI
ncbi:MAG: hypothetical protein ACPGVG_20245 [Mycobacterium sp.]